MGAGGEQLSSEMSRNGEWEGREVKRPSGGCLGIAEYDVAAGVVVAEAPAEGDDILIPICSLSTEDGRGCDEAARHSATAGSVQERRRAGPRSARTRRAFDYEHGDGGSVARGRNVSFEQASLGTVASPGVPAITFCCVPGLAGLEGGGRTYDEWVAPPAQPIDPTASHGCLLDIMQLSACFGVANTDDPQTVGDTVRTTTTDDIRPGFTGGDVRGAATRRCGADAAGARAARRASAARSSGVSYDPSSATTPAPRWGVETTDVGRRPIAQSNAGRTRRWVESAAAATVAAGQQEYLTLTL